MSVHISRNSDAGRRDITVVRADVDAAESLARLGARLFEESFGGDNNPENMHAYLAESFSTEAQRAELADPDRMAWIAMDGSHTAIGYATLRRASRPEGIVASRPAELQRIYADSAWHGRGVGAALMQRCVTQAEAWNCDVLWLGVWERNRRAIAFYEKMGFRTVGRQTFQLGSDLQQDFVMARSLIAD